LRPGAYKTWLFLNFASALINTTVFTTAAIYFVRVVGANPLQLVLIGTVMELAVFLCELPTGAFADSHGRRASVAVSCFLEGVAFLVVGATTSYAAVLGAYVLWGIGATFSSGALEAWITDEMEGRDLEKVFLRGGQFWAGGELLGFGVAALAGSLALSIPFFVGGALSILLAATLALIMPEDHWAPPTAPTSASSPIRRLGGTAIEGLRIVRGNRLFVPVLAFITLLGMYTESYDRLWEAQMLTSVGLPALGDLRPAAWFGLIGAVGLLIGVAVMGVLASRFEYSGPESSLRSLRLLVLLQCGGLLVFAVTNNFFIAIAATYVVNLARGIGGSLFSAWLNRQVESSHRATVLSIANSSDAIGQWVGGPAIGAVGTIFSLRWALSLGALILIPAAGLLEKLRGELKRSTSSARARSPVVSSASEDAAK
jgi:DHA3 family tetracycline resistance protein-like MFS transporter